MVKEFVYYKKNVNYNVGIRYFHGDKDGKILSSGDPVVAIEKENEQDFRLANKRLIIEGLLLPTSAPVMDWETPNVLTDEEVTALVKNRLGLKSRLPSITSVPILYKLLEEAKSQDRAKSIINMIQGRIDEIEEIDDFSSDRDTNDDDGKRQVL